ncbi:hypothetical protein ABMA27_000347 [Loxostege sticticalis]|uniref:MULE transposase domain-containing protein n=1 Tax=Loxostege sticticalis TaxID=481309 RepID=A0ABR3IN27_LOXSC
MDSDCNKEGIKQVPDYESDAECCSDNEVSVPVARKKPKLCLDWKLVQKFDNSEQAKTSLNAEGTWSQHYYSVFMFKTNADHDHDEKKEFTSSYGLSDTVKNEINRLFDLKLKPKAIMESLSKMKNIKVPKMSQLRNYLSDRRRAIYGQSTISLGELEAWIHSHSSLPLDPHEVFVVCYRIEDSDEQNPTFRFMKSNKYLIEISKDARVVHADATYKMIWQGFPVLVCVTTDQNRKFHPLCLTISSNEQKEDFKLMFQGLKDKIQEIFESSWNPKVLVCDAAKSIQNAFLEVFGEHVVVRMCWAHAKRKIQERIARIKNKVLRDNILNDVDALHSITDANIFDAASEAFVQKYEDEIEFVTYFRAQWLLQNRNWFLGAAPNSPSTNNALESFNRVIKDSNTLRERFPLSRFLVVAKEMVNQWSNKYITNPDDNYIANTPSLTTKHWTEAYQWTKNKNVFDAQWESFDDFKKQYFSNWFVSLPTERNDWLKGRCDCPVFFKHVIGLAIRLKYVVPPLEAKNILIGEKRKRGRPSKAKRALIVQ